MKRFFTYLALFAMLANSASAGLVVTGSDHGAGSGSTGAGATLTGYHSAEFHLSSFTGTDNTNTVFTNGLNAVVSMQGSWTVTGGSMYFPRINTGASSGGTAAAQYSNTLNDVGNGTATSDRLLTPFSFMNFDQKAPGTATSTPAAAVVTTSYGSGANLGSWYTLGDNSTPDPDSFVRTTLTPNDAVADSFDQTLVARIWATPGATVTFTGVYASYAAGIDQPVTFNFLVPGGGGGGTVEPIAVTSTPVSGTSRAAGQTVQIANAAAGAGNTKDSATLSALSVTTAGAGTFSQAGLSNGTIAAGASQTGTVAFNGAGLLNGYQATGTMSFSIAGGPTNGGTGIGAYTYPLTATVSGNSGTQTAPVGINGSYAGLSGTSALVTNGGLVHVPSTATILGGINNVGAAATNVSMTWSLRNANEQRPGFTHPPLPNFASALTSDKVDLTGTDGDIFVLQMTYDPTILLNQEATDAADGQLFLASFDGTKWVNAVSLNHGANTSNSALLNVQGAWATAGGSTLVLGAWGVDTVANTVWAVLDHNSLFASVPEPSSIALGLMGLVGLVGFARRRRK